MSDQCEEGSACAVDFSQESKAKSASEQLKTTYLIPIISLLCLLAGLALEFFNVVFFVAPVPLVWFATIYLLVGGKIIFKAAKLVLKGDIYNEFVLMSVATIGAFFIGSYAEGIAVMLFYVVGELFQEAAVDNAKRSIEALLKVQVEEVLVINDGESKILHPNMVKIGQVIQVKPGQKRLITFNKEVRFWPAWSI